MSYLIYVVFAVLALISGFDIVDLLASLIRVK